jgi:general secretion pathway protein M
VTPGWLADWWRGRSPREQILLGILTMLAAAALTLVLVVRPLATIRARAAADIRTYDMLAARLRAGRLVHATRPGPPAQIISQIATANGLSVQRVEPEGARLRVVFADASFDAVVRWVAELERTSALRVSEAQIERAGSGSGVAAQFLVTGG